MWRLLTAVILHILLTTGESAECEPSATRRGSRTFCKGQEIFQEKFYGDNLDTRKWKHEIFMPYHPDYEFVVFDKDHKTLHIENGILTFNPRLLNDDFVRKGVLNLNQNCTGAHLTEECLREGRTFAILPPIKSARITTKESFYFKYGTVEIRAKLPSGDWLTPEIWLEPKKRVYGDDYSSGRIKIATAAGNKQLTCRGRELGGKVLKSGVIIGSENKYRARQALFNLNDGWYNGFHNYKLIWSPDNIAFTVDDREVQYLVPSEGGKIYELLGFNETTGSPWAGKDALAPFDQEFYISLGLSAGGTKEYPDNCYSNGIKKPWGNKHVKGLANFWLHRNDWLKTWNEDSKLRIEYVKVNAL